MRRPRPRGVGIAAGAASAACGQVWIVKTIAAETGGCRLALLYGRKAAACHMAGDVLAANSPALTSVGVIAKKASAKIAAAPSSQRASFKGSPYRACASAREPRRVIAAQGHRGCTLTTSTPTFSPHTRASVSLHRGRSRTLEATFQARIARRDYPPLGPQRERAPRPTGDRTVIES